MLDLSHVVSLLPSSYYSQSHKFLIFSPPLSGVLTNSSLMAMHFNLSKARRLDITIICSII